jgi:hypothetical protein
MKSGAQARMDRASMDDHDRNAEARRAGVGLRGACGHFPAPGRGPAVAGSTPSRLRLVGSSTPLRRKAVSRGGPSGPDTWPGGRVTGNLIPWRRQRLRRPRRYVRPSCRPAHRPQFEWLGLHVGQGKRDTCDLTVGWATRIRIASTQASKNILKRCPRCLPAGRSYRQSRTNHD